MATSWQRPSADCAADVSNRRPNPFIYTPQCQAVYTHKFTGADVGTNDTRSLCHSDQFAVLFTLAQTHVLAHSATLSGSYIEENMRHIK